ncbi:MAG: hypothetical protein A2Y34_15135 [Spirochaetes bacterium GWC1_27_15]|nr:MAG: hypothetical protein A2Z98_03675 [Spirochaetes bacterium GWB1_27_13]OHD21139.1 MAG: hypothetical protein A2Y34_15135 [Spirochaetes bacterium GWC1_27_15]
MNKPVIVNFIRFKILIFSLIIIFYFTNCKTLDRIKQEFKPDYKVCDISFSFIYKLNGVEIAPDVIYIQNLKTFEIYKINQDVDNIYYYDKLPLGEYRFGLWISTFDINNSAFLAFGYTNYKIEIKEEGKYNFGKFIYSCKVVSDSINKDSLSYGFSPYFTSIKKYYLYKDFDVNEEYDTLDAISLYKNLELDKVRVFKAPFYTKESNTYILVKGEFYDINNAKDLRNKVFEKFNNTLIRATNLEKNAISSNLDKIRVEYKNNGKSQAFFLIDSYIANDNNLNYILEKARIYFKENDFVEAENIFEEIFKKNPNVGEYYSFIGEKYFLKNDIEKAKENLIKAIALTTNWASSYDILSKIYLDEKNTKLALLLSDYSLEIESNNIDFINNNLTINKILNNKYKINQLEKKLKNLGQK